MKRIISAFLLAVSLYGCSERGEIKQEPTDFIVIHGKTYKLMSVIPKDGENAIWIMYPKDSLDAMPTVTNYGVTTSTGKSTITTNNTVIKVN